MEGKFCVGDTTFPPVTRPKEEEEKEPCFSRLHMPSLSLIIVSRVEGDGLKTQ